MKVWLSVFIGGGLGSLTRFAISRASMRYIPSEFPWGTLISNMLACLILALSISLLHEKLEAQPLWRFLIITGFCGGFSTFSAFGFESYSLMRTGHSYLAILNIFISLIFALLIMFIILKEYHWNE